MLQKDTKKLKYIDAKMFNIFQPYNEFIQQYGISTELICLCVKNANKNSPSKKIVLEYKDVY